MLGFLFGNYGSMYSYGGGQISNPPLQTTPQVGLGEFDMLQHRVDALELACAGLWKLLKDKHGCTDDELRAAIHDVDASDGAVDGKVKSQGGECPTCHHRLLSRTATKCLWCGAPLAVGPFQTKP